MLNKEELLRKTNNGLDVFKHYIPIPFRIGKNFLNPLYEDSKASCNVYFDRKSGTYRLKDFGNDDYSGDCFFFIGKLKGLDCRQPDNFKEILNIINQDLCLGLSDSNSSEAVSMHSKPVQNIVEERLSKPFHFKEQCFTMKELLYWEQFGIKQDILNHYKVCSVKEFQSENFESKTYTLTSSPEEPIFGYKGKRYIKLYRPFSQIRFLYGGDIGDNYCFGLEQLPAKGDTLFITAGEKDVMALASHGFHAICFNSETVHIPQDIIHNLTFRFKHIILLYDVDKTGLNASAK